LEVTRFMNNPLHKLAGFVGSPKGAKLVVAVWLIFIVALSAIAPGAKSFAISSGEGSIDGSTPSEQAQAALQEQFPAADGPTALLVFHSKQGALTQSDLAQIGQISAWLASADKPAHVAGAVPFHQLPDAARDKLLSEDHTTLLLSVSLAKNLESDDIEQTLQQIRQQFEATATTGKPDLQLEITGPAGIAADTIMLFKNADFVLMFATIGLILVLLIVIYRSPLLAVVPLVIAGMTYAVVDRLLGLAGQNGWFVVDKQALSIMMILLFAVLTDYCLFVVSRYRERLRYGESKYDAMASSFKNVAEPILFSGSTVLTATLALLAAVFKPYYHFAPVFSVAMGVILLSGLTLIPAVYALLGRKAFWPSVPKTDRQDRANPTGFWARMGEFVVNKPGTAAGVLLAVLLLASVNAGTMRFSFNLMKSFPEDMSSRQGFDILEQQFPPGQLAPVTFVLESQDGIEIVPDPAFLEKLHALTTSIGSLQGISEIEQPNLPQPDRDPADASPNLSERKQAVKLQLTLKDNPYDQAALDTLAALRNDAENLLRTSGFDTSRYTLHFAGQTAEQLDVRTLNERDTIVTFLLIGTLISAMLAVQARSIRLAAAMMGTMLLSYAASLGLGWIAAHYLMGYEAISYRLPVYTFVFLIALGVDYNIMLVSRIREEAKVYDWPTAVSRGVALTGGVISSAGIVLAATFCVLITQPMQELFLFGLMMGMGILIDTFLVRGLLLPAIMVFMGRKKTTATPTLPAG